MYLRELFIRNNGPIRNLHVEFAFAPDGNPLPHVIVGRNGTGKTNLLSQIADALMEGAADTYTDVLAAADVGRNWFRVVGGRTLTYQEPNGFSILRFEHADQQLFYYEKSGSLPNEATKEIVPAGLKDGVSWPDNDSQQKQFNIPEETVRSIYPNGSYGFFPSNRSEIPHWLNQAAVRADSFDTADRFSQRLGKSLFIEHGIDDLAQWLMGVLTESRAQINLRIDSANNTVVPQLLDLPSYARGMATLGFADSILQIVMDEPNARFFWAGRRQARKVGVAVNEKPVAAGLDSLSGGQSSLLALFGTILRHGDAVGIQPPNLEGVVVIDELDAHMHIDLQMNALPRLISIFPKVQFIVTGHSPFFTLGMEKQFGPDGLRIIELPGGLTLTAEAYSDFEDALQALRDTRSFENEIRDRVSATEEPIILLGGETDLPYFKTAAELLGFPDLVPHFEWIGTQGPTGSGINTGDNALNAAVSLLKSNPGFTTRKIAIVYDCDANKTNESFDNVHIIGIPTYPDRKAKRGIENLLPNSALTDQFYPQRTETGPYGEEKTFQRFDKTGLCDHLCGADADPANFADFKPILEQIRAALFPSADVSEAGPPDSAGSDGEPSPSDPAL